MRQSRYIGRKGYLGREREGERDKKINCTEKMDKKDIYEVKERKHKWKESEEVRYKERKREREI